MKLNRYTENNAQLRFSPYTNEVNGGDGLFVGEREQNETAAQLEAKDHHNAEIHAITKHPGNNRYKNFQEIHVRSINATKGKAHGDGSIILLDSYIRGMEAFVKATEKLIVGDNTVPIPNLTEGAHVRRSGIKLPSSTATIPKTAKDKNACKYNKKPMIWSFVKKAFLKIAVVCSITILLLWGMMLFQAVLIEHKIWSRYTLRKMEGKVPEFFLDYWKNYLDSVEKLQNGLRLAFPRFPLVKHKIPESNSLIQKFTAMVEYVIHSIGNFWSMNTLK